MPQKFWIVAFLFSIFIATLVGKESLAFETAKITTELDPTPIDATWIQKADASVREDCQLAYAFALAHPDSSLPPNADLYKDKYGDCHFKFLSVNLDEDSESEKLMFLMADHEENGLFYVLKKIKNQCWIIHRMPIDWKTARMDSRDLFGVIPSDSSHKTFYISELTRSGGTDGYEVTEHLFKILNGKTLHVLTLIQKFHEEAGIADLNGEFELKHLKETKAGLQMQVAHQYWPNYYMQEELANDFALKPGQHPIFWKGHFFVNYAWDEKLQNFQWSPKSQVSETQIESLHSFSAQSFLAAFPQVIRKLQTSGTPYQKAIVKKLQNIANIH